MISEVRILGFNDYARQDWKNGGGTTFEIARDARDGGPYRWRLSVAEIAADGPFSRFAGYRRWTCLLEGAGVRLLPATGKPVELRRAGEEFAFEGSLALGAKLIDGPVRDFNLIAASDVTWRARVLGNPETIVLSADTDLVIHSHGGSTRMEIDDHAWDIPAGSTLLSKLDDLVFVQVLPPQSGFCVLVTLDSMGLGERPVTEILAEAGADVSAKEGLPRKQRSVHPWTAKHPAPLTLRAGDSVIVGKIDYEWPAWAQCTTARGHSGWVPLEWLAVEGSRGRIDRDYTARELSIQAGEELELRSEYGGWYFAQNAGGDEGWVPVRCFTM